MYILRFDYDWNYILKNITGLTVMVLKCCFVNLVPCDSSRVNKDEMNYESRVVYPVAVFGPIPLDLILFFYPCSVPL